MAGRRRETTSQRPAPRPRAHLSSSSSSMANPPARGGAGGRPSLLRTITVLEEDARYAMDHPRRGVALVINNVHFSDVSRRREGADRDVLALQPALQTLGFRVRFKDNLSAQQMVDVFQQEVENDHSEEDCFLCVLMSHGKAGDVILGCDDKPVQLKSLVDLLGGDNCRTLRGKPKIFIIVACRGEQTDEGHDMPDGVERMLLLGSASTVEAEEAEVEEEEEEEEDIPLPFEQDFLYIYSTVDGYYSFRTKTGTHFVQTLSDVIKDRGCELEICQLLTLANRATSLQYQVRSKNREFDGKKQCPCFVSCLTKALYFTPKRN